MCRRESSSGSGENCVNVSTRASLIGSWGEWSSGFWGELGHANVDEEQILRRERGPRHREIRGRLGTASPTTLRIM